MTGESVDLSRFKPFLLSPAGLAWAAEGEGVESPGGGESVGVARVEAVVVPARLGVVAVAVADSEAADAGVESACVGAFELMETIAGSCQVVIIGAGAGSTISAGAGAGSSIAGVGAVQV